ncbi:MAG TPA: thioredoxin-dependent thiol peroxidase [Gemmatimonadaceae bacterium]|nr:thioredoxin-dependent thiol peroxidase [Gemmatimonadaceae bacterium]
MLTEGNRAPDFAAATDTGEILSLKSLRGRSVVLYFYPKDDTPGCTVEACEFRDAFPKFEGLDAVVLGVSPDSVKKHQRFKTKYNLPFTLVADPGHSIAESYGVWGEKMMFGRKYMGVLRTTFVIDGEGRIAKIFRSVKPEGHAQEVEQALAASGGARAAR